jgi:hypothetical protein
LGAAPRLGLRLIESVFTRSYATLTATSRPSDAR